MNDEWNSKNKTKNVVKFCLLSFASKNIFRVCFSVSCVKTIVPYSS